MPRQTPGSVYFAALWIALLTLPGAAYATCGAYPGGVGSNDRVLSFVPASSGSHDHPRTSAGTSSEGMVVYDRSLGRLLYCDGSAWRDLAVNTGAASSAPAVAAAWGNNANRALGIASILQTATPAWLHATNFSTTAWKVMASGNSSSCAIRTADKRMFCWGSGSWSVLGNGAFDAGSRAPHELDPQNGWNVTLWESVSLGGSTACAIRSADRRIFCWGAGANGRLGTGDTTANNPSPRELNPTGGWNATAWKQVSTGASNTCAIRAADDRIFCWGDGSNGRLGTGDTLATNSTPRELDPTGGWNTTAWKQVSTGASNTCAIRAADDRIFCWGDGSNGRLGTGDTLATNSTPRELDPTGGWNTTAWKHVSAGSSHTCAIRASDDRIFCWGSGANGRLGTGDALATNSTPRELDPTGSWNTTSWKHVSAGSSHTCAIRASDDRLFCWGEGTGGRLGTGDIVTTNSTPRELDPTGSWNTTAWKHVSAGGDFSCAIRSTDDRIFCWGNGFSNQLGTGDNTTLNPSPRELLSSSGWNTTSLKSISAGGYRTCAIRASDDRIFCWGAGTAAPTELSSTGGWNTTAWKAVSAGHSHVCAIRLSDDYLFCWGSAANGRLGTGNTTDRVEPTELDPNGGWNTMTWKSVSVSANHTCAIRADDRLFCWGYGVNNELGTGDALNSNPTPRELSATGGWNTTAWKSVVTGSSYTCAIRLSDNRIFCWGSGWSGKLGTGSTTDQPIPVELNATGGWNTTAWKSVSVGTYHTCAIRASDDRLFCWGDGSSGQLGTGDTTATNSSPRALLATGNWSTTAWKSVSAGGSHTCAIRLSDNKLFCWGAGDKGQLGTGDKTAVNSAPRELNATGDWSNVKWDSVEAGGEHTIAIESASNFRAGGSLPIGVAADEPVMGFQAFGGIFRFQKSSHFQEMAAGFVVFDSAANTLVVNSGGRWLPLRTIVTGTSCSAYPDANASRVIEFFPDGQNKVYNASRVARPTPRAGTLTYNSVNKVLQICDGTNWRSLVAEVAATYTTPSSFSWTVPFGITSLACEAWGAGAGGASAAGQAAGGGGGGYSRKIISVTPGETLTVTVGAGGTTGVSGGASRIARGGTPICEATGGLSTGGASPTPTTGLYDTWFAGGAGAAAQGGGGSRAGSGGGGGAGSGGAGGAGTAGASSTAGSGGTGGTPDGGAGGAGGALGAGVNGSSPGGGGGGSGSSSSVSGTGGDGQLRISFP